VRRPIYYVSSRPGFACDLQPWLLPATGDRSGALVGQPLNPYGGGQTIAGNDLEGQQVWSPDSTRVRHEQLPASEGPSPERADHRAHPAPADEADPPGHDRRRKLGADTPAIPLEL
jgi:hypothetical protein